MPPQRQAVWSLLGPEDQTITFLADFDQLTLTRTQVGGYQRGPTGAQPFTPEAADAFWKQLEALASKGLRDEHPYMVDGQSWRFEARDDKNVYAASGQISDTFSTGGENEKYGQRGDSVPEVSHADIAGLFALLKS